MTLDGTPPYVIDWDNNTYDGMEDLTGLGAGNYSVTVTDADGCSESAVASIASPGSAMLSETHVDDLCTASTGSIDLTISGASTSIIWSNGATSENLTGLSAGTYSVSVNNASGCLATLSVNIEDTAGPTLSTSHTDEICGNTNGTIDLSVAGGVTPYEYQWDNDGVADADDIQDLTNLAAGTYNVTVTDANMCTTVTVVTIANISGPSLSSSLAHETCANSNGSIDLTVTNGTAPFIYSWNNGLSSEDVSGVAAGTYEMTVTDANGCSATTSMIISNSDGPTLSTSVTNSMSCVTNDGSVDLTISGGAMPYMIDWDNDGFGENGDMEDLSNLTAGGYMVIITDANGCQANTSIFIANSNDPVVGIVVTDPTTCLETGSFDLTVTGGAMPYTYDWNNDGLGDNDDLEDISGLIGGAYSVIVTDANGCSIQENASIRSIRPPLLSGNFTEPTCGVADGTIDLVILDPDGTTPYTYNWSNGETTEDITSLAAGNYTVTVSNGISCSTVMTFNLPSVNAPEIILIQSNPTCAAANGGIDMTISGGNPPYMIDWDNNGIGDTNDAEDLSAIAAGIYNVMVTDASGCQVPGAVELVTSMLPVLSGVVTDENDMDGQGAIDLTINGIAPFMIDWDNNGIGDTDDPEDLSGLSAGTYTVTVTDGNGCTNNLITNQIREFG